MLTRIWKTYKKQCIIAIVALAAVLIPLYLYFMFQTGIRYNDAFLVQQKDGSFKGEGYALSVTPTPNGADITFTANDETRTYSVVNTQNAGVEFYQNGTLTHTMQVEQMGDFFTLIDENGEAELPFRILYSNQDEDDLFPTNYELYGWTREIQTGIRGEPMFLFFAALFGIPLFLDIRYPDLFFELRYRRYVDGDCEPSEYYRFWQVIGRVISAIAIVIFLWMGLLNIV